MSKAGGLGVLGRQVSHTPEQLEIDLEWIEAEIGDVPYGVDLIVPARYAGDADGGYSMDDIRALIPPQAAEFVDDILRRYEVPELPGERCGRGKGAATARGSGRRRAVLGQRGRRATGHRAGPPGGVRRRRARTAAGVHDREGAGRRTSHRRPRRERGARAATRLAAGVDIIIAQGGEAGGHTGEIGSMVLIPEVVDATAPVPVLGAGGIGRGRQMAAAMALGAQGVWCGSVWLTTEEGRDPSHREAQEILATTSSDTIRSRSLTGKPARMLKSAWTEEWAREDTPEPLGMPLQPVLTNTAQARIAACGRTPGSGAEKLANYFVGQIVGSMNRRRSPRRWSTRWSRISSSPWSHSPSNSSTDGLLKYVHPGTVPGRTSPVT